MSGTVTGYRFASGGVLVRWTRAKHCAASVLWHPEAAQSTTASGVCGSSTRETQSVATKLSAAQGDRLVRVVLAPASADRPDRLDVFARSTHRLVASWPLFERPARVALYGDIAILSAAKRRAIDALSITDGRIAMLGIARAGDAPVIASEGVVYQDDLDLSMRRASPNRVTLKLVPLATVRRQLAARGSRQISTTRIGAISMDGKRVAFVAHDPQAGCDRVLFWSIPWHFVAPFNRRVGPTCLPSHAPGSVTSVALAGDRAVWTTQYGTQTRVLAASIINCVEWVIARPVTGSVAGLSGHGGVLAYALAGKSSASTVSLVPNHWRSVRIERSASRVVAISADNGRVASLHADGTVTIVTRRGRQTATIDVGTARAIALHRKTLAVLRAGQLDVYGLPSRRLTGSFRVPADSSSVDVQYGIAVVTSGSNVLAVNTANGHTARLFHAPGPVAAQIEAPGAGVQYNAGSRGFLRFVPMSVIEARTG